MQRETHIQVMYDVKENVGDVTSSWYAACRRSKHVARHFEKIQDHIPRNGPTRNVLEAATTKYTSRFILLAARCVTTMRDGKARDGKAPSQAQPRPPRRPNGCSAHFLAKRPVGSLLLFRTRDHRVAEGSRVLARLGYCRDRFVSVLRDEGLPLASKSGGDGLP